MDYSLNFCSGSRGGSCLQVDDFDIIEPVLDADIEFYSAPKTQEQQEVIH